MSIEILHWIVTMWLVATVIQLRVELTVTKKIREKESLKEEFENISPSVAQELTKENFGNIV